MYENCDFAFLLNQLIWYYPMGYGQFATRTIRYGQFATDSSLQDSSLHGQIATWTVRYTDSSLHGQFATWTVRYGQFATDSSLHGDSTTGPSPECIYLDSLRRPNDNIIINESY